MTETNLPYHCPICINDFTDEGITPFNCGHKLCNDCNEEFRKSKFYKCPLCKSDTKKNSINRDILAVKQHWCALEYIENQTEELCRMAINQNEYAIQYVINQTEELCRLAVEKNGYAIRYVQNQTEELCRLAIQRNNGAFVYIRNQTEELCKMVNQHEYDFPHSINGYVFPHSTIEERRTKRILYGSMYDFQLKINCYNE